MKNDQERIIRFSGSLENQNRTDSFRPIKPLELNKLDEAHAMVMVVLFFTSAFTIVSFFNRTLITVIDASKLFAVFGIIGFLMAYLARKKLRLSLLDGLFYNLFGTAPVVLAMFLAVNSAFSTNEQEVIYQVIDRESGGSGYTCVLENNALDEFWHIRALDSHETNARCSRIKYVMAEGFFGIPVMKSRELV